MPRGRAANMRRSPYSRYDSPAPQPPFKKEDSLATPRRSTLLSCPSGAPDRFHFGTPIVLLRKTHERKNPFIGRIRRAPRPTRCQELQPLVRGVEANAKKIVSCPLGMARPYRTVSRFGRIPACRFHIGETFRTVQILWIRILKGLDRQCVGSVAARKYRHAERCCCAGLRRVFSGHCIVRYGDQLLYWQMRLRRSSNPNPAIPGRQFSPSDSLHCGATLGTVASISDTRLPRRRLLQAAPREVTPSGRHARDAGTSVSNRGDRFLEQYLAVVAEIVAR